jgi:hypothetical protein
MKLLSFEPRQKILFQGKSEVRDMAMGYDPKTKTVC